VQQTIFCVVCGARVLRKRFRCRLNRTTCSVKCRNKLIATTRTTWPLVGEKNPSWKGGIRISWGYVYLYRPDHPRAVQGYVKRANLVVKERIGRSIRPNEVVHHRNGNKQDDRPANLQVMTKGEHQRLHTRIRKRLGAYKRIVRRKGTLGRFV
jgi:HNH endonuclease